MTAVNLFPPMKQTARHLLSREAKVARSNPRQRLGFLALQTEEKCVYFLYDLSWTAAAAYSLNCFEHNAPHRTCRTVVIAFVLTDFLPPY